MTHIHLYDRRMHHIEQRVSAVCADAKMNYAELAERISQIPKANPVEIQQLRDELASMRQTLDTVVKALETLITQLTVSPPAETPAG